MNSAALQRLKEARRRGQQAASSSSSSSTRPAQHAAAASDAANEAYMQEFEAAFQQLSCTPQGTTNQSGQSGQLPHAACGAQPTPSGHPALDRRKPASSTGSLTSGVIQAARSHAAGMAARADFTTPVAPSWRTGPVDEAGVLVQLSDRPLLCSAAMTDSGDVVVGSADHALYVVDTATGRKKRTLYSKTTGHTEWVTTVCCLPGGRVLSGGMDGRLWLWPSAGAAGCEVKSAHEGPIAKVAALQQPAQPEAAAAAQPTGAARAGSAHSSSGSSKGRAGVTRGQAGLAAAGMPVLAVSCSYDKTVRVWDVSGRAGKQLAVLSGHTGPVLELAVAPGGGALLTGDRKGNLMAWDVSTASSGWGCKEAHAGHITALAWQQADQQGAAGGSSSMVALSGGQDGWLRVWDGRTGSSVAQQALHVDARGKGAIGSIVTVSHGGGQLVVTAGADGTLKVVDPSASYRPCSTLQLTDFPYSLAAVGDGLVVCGCGDGSVHVVDAVQGRTLYALGAGQAAVRALETGPGRLVCAGDDGCVVCYTFV